MAARTADGRREVFCIVVLPLAHSRRKVSRCRRRLNRRRRSLGFGRNQNILRHREEADAETSNAKPLCFRVRPRNGPSQIQNWRCGCRAGIRTPTKGSKDLVLDSEASTASVNSARQVADATPAASPVVASFRGNQRTISRRRFGCTGLVPAQMTGDGRDRPAPLPQRCDLHLFCWCQHRG